MTKTILVLGAHGMVGRRLIPLLEAEGAEVRAASRTPAGGETRFDWDDEAGHVDALTGVDAVFLVPQPMIENPHPGMARLIKRAGAAGVTRLVALTSLGVTFPDEPDWSWRKAIEAEVEASGLEWTILRPGGFSQNFSESFLLPGILHAGVVATATGAGCVSFIDAEDIAAVAARCLLDEGHVGARYSLTGPQALSFGDAAGLISDACGRKVAFANLTSREFQDMLESAGLPAGYAEIVVRDQEAIRAGHADIVTTTVREVTGRPAVTFQDYVDANRAAWAAAPPGADAQVEAGHA